LSAGQRGQETGIRSQEEGSRPALASLAHEALTPVS
jgi:hypothetical protein